MTKKEMDKQELEWQAERDADTIARYNEIINDKPRLDRAMKKAKEQIDNLTERAQALNRSLTGLKKKK